jgi:DNA adenine methylase
MKPKEPAHILEEAFAWATTEPGQFGVKDPKIRDRIEYVATCISNRAGVRLLLSCMLAKLHRPEVDPRNPYTEIGGDKSFSGRHYDEAYITGFINKHHLPCNSTTAFLTPALRNMDVPLNSKVTIIGRPPQVYSDTLRILQDVAQARVSASDVMTDTIRFLLALRDERQSRLTTLAKGIARTKGALPLSSEAIVHLIEQHLACKHSSRLPVLVIAAAYTAARNKLGERVLPLRPHTAADEQTGALGDVEICLADDDNVVTIYEMKTKRIITEDIDRAIQKLDQTRETVDNYIFVTTDSIDDEIREYAANLYEITGGVEFVMLDCIGFLRHFLHLFHRIRTEFLDAYQSLVLTEPESAVNQPLKEAFLSLRQAAIAEE